MDSGINLLYKHYLFVKYVDHVSLPKDIFTIVCILTVANILLIGLYFLVENEIIFFNLKNFSDGKIKSHTNIAETCTLIKNVLLIYTKNIATIDK